MTIVKILGSLLALALGIFLVVFGEGDDSPGAQLLGLLIALAGIWSLIKIGRTVRRKDQ